MQSMLKIQTITALAMGTLLGTQNAAAWCPTASDRSIPCSNCKVVLSCNVFGLQPISITGNNVTFDGQGYDIRNSPNNAITVASRHAVIKNVKVYYATTSAIHAISNPGDVLIVENVLSYVVGGAGLSHYYSGNVSVIGGLYWQNGAGIYLNGYYSSASGKAYIYDATVSDNLDNGIFVKFKPNSEINNSLSQYNFGHGALIESSPGTIVSGNMFILNSGSGKNGLRLVSSNNSQINSNEGYRNASYDCNVLSSSGVTRAGNFWVTHNGPCMEW